jgi:hypothetical protein
MNFIAWLLVLQVNGGLAQEFVAPSRCGGGLVEKVLPADGMCGYQTTGIFKVGLILDGGHCKVFQQFVRCLSTSKFQPPNRGSATGDGPRF